MALNTKNQSIILLSFVLSSFGFTASDYSFDIVQFCLNKDWQLICWITITWYANLGSICLFHCCFVFVFYLFLPLLPTVNTFKSYKKQEKWDIEGVFRSRKWKDRKYDGQIFKDTKGVIRSRKSKNRKYDGQKKQDKTKMYKTLQRKLRIEQDEPH